MNERNLCYHYLTLPVFSDMMFDFGLARAFSLASRSEAHETLSLLFARDGVLQTFICDNAKEVIHGMFYQKLKDAACHLKQL